MGTKGINYPAKPSRKPDPRPSPARTRGHKTIRSSPVGPNQTITIPDRSFYNYLSHTTTNISYTPPIYTLPTKPVAPPPYITSPHTSTPPPSPPSPPCSSSTLLTCAHRDLPWLRAPPSRVFLHPRFGPVAVTTTRPQHPFPAQSPASLLPM